MYLTRPIAGIFPPSFNFPFPPPIEKARPSAAETGPAGVLFSLFYPFIVRRRS